VKRLAPPRAELAAGAVVALLLALEFHEVVFGGQVFFERDVHLLWHAQAAAFVRALAAGEWPLWDPHLAFGQPLLGNPNNQVLYPPTWLLGLVPAWSYYSMLVLGHLTLGAVGVAALARRLGLSVPGSTLAAALWALSGPVLSLVSMWSHLCGAAWLPWALFAAEGLARGLAGRHWAVLGGSLAAQVLAGSPDLALLTGLLVAARIGMALAAARHSRSRSATLRGAVLALAVALGLSAGQSLLTLELLRDAQRRELSDAARGYWSVPPPALLQTVLPVLYKDIPLAPRGRPLGEEFQIPLLGSLYVGLPAALLAVAALGARRPRLVAALGLMAAASVLLALGRHSVVSDAIGGLPPLSMLRHPAKAMVVLAPAWALLCGAGLDAWRRHPGHRLAGLLAWPIVGLALCAVALGLVAAYQPSRLLALVGPEAASSPSVLLPAAASLARAGSLTLAVVALWLLSARRRVAWAAPLAAALAVFDLASFHRPLNPVTGPGLYTSRPPVLSALPPSRPARIYAWDYLRIRTFGRPTTSPRVMAARVPPGFLPSLARAVSLQAYLYPPSQGRWGVSGSFDKDLVALDRPVVRSMTLLPRAYEGSPALVRILRAGGVETVLTLHDEGLEALEPVSRLDAMLAEPVRVFRVPQPLPRAYLVPRATRLDDRQLAARITDPGFDPAREVLLSDGAAPDDGARPVEPAFDGRARLVHLGADRVEIRTESASPAYAVLLDAWDPAWRASVDGTAVPLLRANGAFRAVRVEPGVHRVTMTYRPATLLVGLASSGLTVLALLAAPLAGLASRSRVA
jgi:hypothetical protein